MNVQYEEESATDRILDVVVGIVALVPKLLLLLWALLAGGMPVALQAPTAVPTAEVVMETAERSEEVAIAAAATDVPPTATMVVPTPAPTVAAPSIEEAGVLDPGNFAIDPAALGLAWAAQQIGGVAADPANNVTGVPPHLLVDFAGDGAETEAAIADPIGLNRPQIRIIPVAAYLRMLEAAGTEDAAAAFDSLKALLEQQPSGADADIPAPPIVGGVAQQPVARVDYLGFAGGQGVGYVAHYATATGPITNENGLDYVVQGLTDDAQHYVLVLWPLSASFLPSTAADVADDTLNEISSDISAYLAEIDAETEAAADSDFTPDLSSLREALSTIAIGAGMAAANTSMVADQTPEAELIGTVWQWTSFADPSGANDLTVSNPENYQIVFWPEGEYSLKADCNVGGGTYVLDGASLTINPGFSTLAFCGPESLDSQFREYLFSTATYVFDEDGNLVLNLMADAGDMVFANAGPAEFVDSGEPEDQAAAEDAGLTSTAFRWSSLVDADGNEVAVENPEDYVVILNPDGTFNFQADCNVGSGTYVYNEDGTISFVMGPMTLAFCGEDSLDQQFLAALGSITNVATDEDGNVVATLADGQTVGFTNAGPVATDGEVTEITMAPTADIIGTVWQWNRFEDTAGINDLTVPDPENYQLILWPDGAFSIKADCNIGRGSYTLDGSSLSLVVGPTTRALCAPDSLSDPFIAYLGQTVTYVMNDDDELVLNLFADSGNMVFGNGGPAELGEAAEAEDQPGAADAGLTGLSFNWQSFTDADGNPVTVENPENYSLVLLPDGTFNIKADCNVGAGTYTYSEDGSITFDLGPLTRALCGPDSLSDDFLAFVNGISGATANPDGTVTVTTADGGEASFVSGGPVEIPQVTEPVADVEAQPAPGGELFDTIWNWTSLEDSSGATTLTVDEPTRYQVLFGTDATYFIRADCNTGSGSYSGQGDETINALTIDPGITTLAACGEDSLDAQFTSNLFATESYTFDADGNLRLALADGNTMVFASGGSATELTSQPEPQIQPTGPANALEGTTWQWVSFRDAKQDYGVEGSENYTITFLVDGAVGVQADCNNGSGSYTVDGSSLTVSILITTAAACPEGSLGDVFIDYLNQAAIFTIDGTTMRIDLVADGGTMTFVKVE